MSVGGAANKHRAMGNHLVAKLAFFPPDPVKYTQQGPIPPRCAARMGVVC